MSNAKLIKKRDRAQRKVAKWNARLEKLNRILAAHSTLETIVESAPAPLNCQIPDSVTIAGIQGKDIGRRKVVYSDGTYHGIYGDVASCVGLHPETVRSIDRAKTGSTYVRAVLQAFRESALRLTNNGVIKPAREKVRRDWIAPPADFQRGGKYYGLRQRVATELGIRDSSVRDATSGRRSMPKVVEVLRAHMSRIDAELKELAQ